MGFGLGRSAVFLFVLFCFGCSRVPETATILPAPSDSKKELKAGELARDKAQFRDSRLDETKQLDVEKYDLKASYDWETEKLKVISLVTLRLLDSSSKQIVLESRVAKINSVTLADKSALPFTHEGGLLNIDISSLSDETRRAPLTLALDYETGANYVGDGEPSALTAVRVRESDPVKARAAFTTSEPQGASDWLPCHNVPDDRALFSIELTMPEEDRLISNGDLIYEKVAGGRRVMRYGTRYTIPTYLMAFAVGQFDVVTEKEGELPVSIWYRKGLPGVHREVLAQLRHAIRKFEKLVGPYPFEKYALVLLPEFPSGGLENVSITFQAEHRSTESRSSADYGLSAHELAHQWFGDYMTIKNWDDLWIKEGMATLLAEEATRDWEDRNRRGRLFGETFFAMSGEAMQDPELLPEQKYTSGPYDRSAWFLTQLRATTGEKEFWTALRNALEKFKFSAISTDEFLEFFAPYLDRATFSRLKKAVVAKAVPSIQLLRDEGDKRIFLLSDPDGAMIAPLKLAWMDERGSVFSSDWDPGTELTVEKNEARLLLLDPQESQALASFRMDKGLFDTHFVPLLKPRTETQLRQWLDFPGSAHILSLSAKTEWKITPATAAEIYTSLPSEAAKFHALQRFCETGKASPITWRPFVRSRLANPPWMGLPRFSAMNDLAACHEVAGAMFAAKWNQIMTEPKEARASELNFFSFFPQKPTDSILMWLSVLQQGSSVRAQTSAISGLSRHLQLHTVFGSTEYQNRVQELLRQELRKTDVSEVQTMLLGLAGLIESENVRDLAALVKRSRRPSVQTRAICAAFSAQEKNEKQWESLVASGAFGDLAAYPTRIRHFIEKPGPSCGGE